jgi:hypothetical protein
VSAAPAAAGVPAAPGDVLGSSLALGPIPEVGFVLQVAALFGAFGAIAAARRFGQTGDPDERWMITTRWATFGLVIGIIAVFCHLTVGVP